MDSIIDNLPADIRSNLQYDAVFVDEGQDFTPHWWRILSKLTKDGGEKIFVADYSQDIYGRGKEWSFPVMEKFGLRGPWNVLVTSYRLPSKIADLAAFFNNKFLHSTALIQKDEQKQGSLLTQSNIEWIQCQKEDAVNVLEEAIKQMMRYTGNQSKLANSDITLICDQIEVGIKVMDVIKKESKIKFIHTFSKDKHECQKLKHAFFKGSEKLKSTTIHSFKGWESPLLIVYVPDLSTQKNRYLFYTALTRLKRTFEGPKLTIVCSDLSKEVVELAEFVNKLNGI